MGSDRVDECGGAAQAAAAGDLWGAEWGVRARKSAEVRGGAARP